MEHALARLVLAVSKSMTVIFMRALTIARGVPTAIRGLWRENRVRVCSLSDQVGQKVTRGMSTQAEARP